MAIRSSTCRDEKSSEAEQSTAPVDAGGDLGERSDGKDSRMTGDEQQHSHRFGGEVPPAASRPSPERWRSSANFTEAGLRVIANAHVEAYAHRSDHVGTEHLLLALIAAQHDVVDETLRHAGLGADDIRARVEVAIGPAQQPRAAHLPYSPDVKRALAASVDEAQFAEDHLIDVAHILYGIFRQHNCVAARLVAGLGVDPESICDQAVPQRNGRTAGGAARRSNVV